MLGTLNHRHDWRDLKMAAARPFKGTVKNEQGTPSTGPSSVAMQVRFTICPKAFSRPGPMLGGEFEIDDVSGIGLCVIEHPEYARRTLNRLPFDQVAELMLSHGGIVEGQVIDTVTGRPAGGLSVSIQPINRTIGTESCDLTRPRSSGPRQRLTAADATGSARFRMENSMFLSRACRNVPRSLSTRWQSPPANSCRHRRFALSNGWW